jgi:hypothetical protein
LEPLIIGEGLDLTDAIPPEALKGDKKNSPMLDHVKQGIAGVTDAFTGLPSLIGMGKAAIEAGATAATSDKKFIPEFADNMANSDLVKAGTAGREWVNDKLGIKDPETGLDLGIRLATGAVIPVPGSVETSLAGKVGMAALPFIKTTTPILSKGNAIRYGAQEAMNFGVDQGMRALNDQPLIWQDENDMPEHEALI